VAQPPLPWSIRPAQPPPSSPSLPPLAGPRKAAQLPASHPAARSAPVLRTHARPTRARGLPRSPQPSHAFALPRPGRNAPSARATARGAPATTAARGPTRQGALSTVHLPQNGSAQFSRPRRLQNRTVRDFCAVSRPPSPPLVTTSPRTAVGAAPPAPVSPCWRHRRRRGELTLPFLSLPLSSPLLAAHRPAASVSSVHRHELPVEPPCRLRVVPLSLSLCAADGLLPSRPAARSEPGAPACRPRAPSPCSFTQPRPTSPPLRRRTTPLRVVAESLRSLRSLHAQLLSVPSAVPARNPRMLLAVPRYCYLARRVLVKSHARGFSRDHGYCTRRRRCLHSPHAVSRVSRAQSTRIS
jgi:hypothetical protein